MNQLSLVQAVNRFGKSVVMAVTPTSDRRLDARLGQSLALPDRHVLRAATRMVDQRIVALRLPVIQGLLPCIENTKSVRMELLCRQATIRGAYTSISKATYCPPCQVET